MGSRLLSELEQDSFEPDEYVERLAWRATSNQNSTGTVGVSSIEEDFDAQALHEAFRIAIQDLSAMQEKQKIKCQALEQVCLLLFPSCMHLSAGHALENLICWCGLLYKRELWASKSEGFNSM